MANNSLKEWERDLLKFADDLSGQETKKFLRKELKKLQKKTLTLAEQRTKKYTGNYIKSIKNGKIYDYEGNLAGRVYSYAPHSHLIEYGHNVIVHRENKGYVRGKYIFKDAKDDFKDEFSENVENFVDEILKKNNL